MAVISTHLVVFHQICSSRLFSFSVKISPWKPILNRTCVCQNKIDFAGYIFKLLTALKTEGRFYYFPEGLNYCVFGEINCHYLVKLFLIRWICIIFIELNINIACVGNWFYLCDVFSCFCFQTFLIVANKFGKQYVYRFHASDSLYLFSPRNRIRRFVLFLITHQYPLLQTSL